MRQAAIFLVALLNNVMLWSQPTTSDCQGAIPVCAISYDVPVLNPQPNNIPNEINPQLSCLSSGENNGNWYTFTIQSDGLLGFNVIPYEVVDYDWALFDLTNANCSDIATNAALQVACNYSSSISNGGITGANGGNNLQDEALIPVQNGQTFVLYVSNYNFNINAAGYQLDFSLSTAQVPDNTPPTLLSLQANADCNATQLILTFSENVLCNSVTSNSFVLNGPGGPYSISSVSSPDCSAGAPYSTTYRLNISPALTKSGTFTLQALGGVVDVCGNALQGNPTLDLIYNALQLDLSSTDSDCPVDNGTATVNASSGTPPYVYLWNDATAQTTATATGLPRGWYTVQVNDAGGCTVRDSVFVSDPTSFTLNVSHLPDTCYKGAGLIEVQINGNTPPYTILWQDSLSLGNLITNAIGDSIYKIRVIDDEMCKRDTLIKMTVILNDTLQASFVTDKDKVNILTPTVLLTNTSLHAYSILWDINGFFSSDQNIVYDFPDIGLIPIRLTAFDVNGCSHDTLAYIEVVYDLSFYIPNSFTPNVDGLNETFTCTGIGLDPERFQMMIYDRFGQQIFSTSNINAGWDGSLGNYGGNRHRRELMFGRLKSGN
jgi:gliding motility-associated-like protein